MERRLIITSFIRHSMVLSSLLWLWLLLVFEVLCLNRDKIFSLQEVIQQGLKADEWVMSVSELLGGKCGGKDLSAQGSGPNVGCLKKAVETATQFAKQKLWHVTTFARSSELGSTLFWISSDTIVFTMFHYIWRVDKLKCRWRSSLHQFVTSSGS